MLWNAKVFTEFEKLELQQSTILLHSETQSMGIAAHDFWPHLVRQVVGERTMLQHTPALVETYKYSHIHTYKKKLCKEESSTSSLSFGRLLLFREHILLILILLLNTRNNCFHYKMVSWHRLRHVGFKIMILYLFYSTEHSGFFITH